MLDTLVAPAYLWVPDHASTAGGEAFDLAAECGMHLDGEQRLILDAMLAEAPDGKWAALEAAVICARQNLKTYALEAVVLADLFLFGAEVVTWTAHLFATTMEAFRDLKRVIDSHDHLSRRVKRISEANGEEAIELTTGQRLLFRARSKSGGRGLSGDRLIFDEAFALGASSIGSLFPTLSARQNPQVIYASSAGQLGSEVLRSVRDRGRPGGDPSLAYVEWCAPVKPCADDRCDHRYPAPPGCALDDRDAWQQGNPTLGRRIPVRNIEGERRALPPTEFARERLGWWEEPEGAAGGLPAELWKSRAIKAVPGTLLALAVDVMPDSTWTSIGRVTSAAGGVILDVAAHRKGTEWAAAEVVALRGDTSVPVVVDVAGAASVVAADLRKDHELEPTEPTGRDVAQGCTALVDGLMRNAVSHLDQAELNAAVAGAVRRPLGDAWAWSRKSSLVDISPLVAVTLALWGTGALVQTEQEPNIW